MASTFDNCGGMKIPPQLLTTLLGESNVSDNGINDNSFDVAIIGMACRFPGAENIDEYWEILKNGVESVEFLSDEDLKSSNVDESIFNEKNYIKACSTIDNIDLFDADFFGYSHKEAAIIDPQQRIFLELAWQVLEGAGYKPGVYPGPIGVFAGTGFNTYLINNVLNGRRLQANTDGFLTQISNDKDNLATRLSYKLNLRGPSVTVQTACSTSAVAVHFACQNLLNFDCDMAIAGGVTIRVPQKAGYFYQKDMILSGDGHCRPFDEGAQGTVFGNGAGIVLLKRLEDAITDGDEIVAVIKGSAINNDGASKVSYMAPSIEGQKEVIAKALAMSGVSAESIGAIEAHATGTLLGDPIEVQALTEVFSSRVKEKRVCALGAVKGNIGHLENAAGIASLIKMALCLKNKRLVPSINFEKPNPHLNLDKSPFYVNTKLQEWKRHNGEPLRCGVSAFGIGGTNAHVVMEEFIEEVRLQKTSSVQLVNISAKSQNALQMAGQNLLQYLQRPDSGDLSDIAYTLRMGRHSYDYRQVIVCNDKESAIKTFEIADSRKMWSSRILSRPQIAFMFPEQESQYLGMVREIYETKPLFKKEVDYCSEILKKHMNFDIRTIMLSNNSKFDVSEGCSKPIVMTQAVAFSIEYALAKLLLSWGIKPQAMVGSSMGEYVAACLAEVLTLEDALFLIAKRTTLLGKLPEGDTTEQISESFLEVMRKIPLKRPSVSYLSSVTGTWITDAQATDPKYWSEQLDKAVDLSPAISELLEKGVNVFVEIGQGTTLGNLVKSYDKNVDVINSLPNLEKDGSSLETLMICIGRLWTLGIEIDWEAFQGDEQYYRITLPTYPFERKRYWIEPENSKTGGEVMTKESSGCIGTPKQEDSGQYNTEDTQDYVERLIQNILGRPHESKIDPSRQLMEYGMDSMSAIELREKVMNQRGIQLDAQKLFSVFTMEEIVRQIELLKPKECLKPIEEVVSLSPWEMDKELPIDVTLKSGVLPFDPNRSLTNPFLTGITGSIGAFLCNEILEKTSADVYCLVRAKSISSGMKRIQENLDKYSLWKESYRSRIIPVLGDLTKPHLGIDIEIYNELSKCIDTIYHCAAYVNHLLNYHSLKAINVDGTLSIIEFAGNAKIKSIHFISTIAVYYHVENNALLPVDKSEEALQCGNKIYNGYGQTKWVSEHHLLQAHEKGIPITIFRCGQATGCTKNGFGIAEDMFHSFLKIFSEVKAIPNWADSVMDILPIDHISEVIFAVSQQSECNGKIYNLTNLNPIPTQEYFAYLKKKNPSLPEVSFEEWAECCLEYVSNLPESPRRSILISFFKKLDSGYRTFDAYFHKMNMGHNKMKKVLQKTSVQPPKINEHVWEKYMSQIKMIVS